MWKSLQQLHMFSLQVQYLFTLSVACFNDNVDIPMLLCLEPFTSLIALSSALSSRSMKLN